MYTKEEREGILWEFHRSGLSAPAACRSLPLFPNKDNLYAWLKLEEAGELTAREMPDRAERMHCSHGEGSPAFAARRPGTEPASPRKRRAEGGAGKMERTGRGGAGGEPPEQTDWRDWGLEGLPDDPAERAREAEVRLAEALAVLDVLKAPGPGSGLATLMWTVPGGARETGGPYMRDPRHPRHFTDEFKRQIVDLYNAGKPKREIMDEYDLGKSTVERWIKSINATGSPRAADNRTPEQNRILELERENRRLRMEVDVLKQAALIYARK